MERLVAGLSTAVTSVAAALGIYDAFPRSNNLFSSVSVQTEFIIEYLCNVFPRNQVTVDICRPENIDNLRSIVTCVLFLFWISIAIMTYKQSQSFQNLSSVITRGAQASRNVTQDLASPQPASPEPADGISTQASGLLNAATLLRRYLRIPLSTTASGRTSPDASTPPDEADDENKEVADNNINRSNGRRRFAPLGKPMPIILQLAHTVSGPFRAMLCTLFERSQLGYPPTTNRELLLDDAQRDRVIRFGLGAAAPAAGVNRNKDGPVDGSSRYNG